MILIRYFLGFAGVMRVKICVLIYALVSRLQECGRSRVNVVNGVLWDGRPSKEGVHHAVFNVRQPLYGCANC